MFFKGRKVLVTGASGLMGSHFIEELLRRGASVVGTLHKKPPVIQDPRVEYRKGDLARKEDCVAAVQGCDSVILAAANTSGALVMRDNPVAHITENLLINSQLMEAAWRAKVERFLFVSSTTVYPAVEYEVKEEEGFVGDPHPSYQGVGWMKRYSEKLANFYHDKFGIKMAIVRPTNLYGPRDKFDPDTSHVLPALMRRAIEGADPFEVWGDGTAVRDFVYVTDAIDGMLAAMEKCGDGIPVNIGNGTPVTVRESVETILKLVGRPKAKIVFDPTKPTSIPKRVVSLVKARQVLGYAPKVTFEEGLRKTIDWYKGTLAVAGGGPK